MLKFALEQKVFIGVDGDATYDPRKQAFIKKVPLDLLVLETDSPFLMPEPIRSERRFPNTPANLRYIAEICAYLKDLRVDEIVRITTENAFKLFRLK
ncbi:MAG: hypothetical protein KatS3mg090_0606 [Patescibacteria group bacterium]|nr:MAG: hypothetical protein KatS3mg090_0606 [Patescibacteria group bacterium]